MSSSETDTTTDAPAIAWAALFDPTGIRLPALAPLPTRSPLPKTMFLTILSGVEQKRVLAHSTARWLPVKDPITGQYHHPFVTAAPIQLRPTAIQISTQCTSCRGAVPATFALEETSASACVCSSCLKVAH